MFEFFSFFVRIKNLIVKQYLYIPLLDRWLFLQLLSQLLFSMTLSVITRYFLLGIFTERLSRFFDMQPISVGVFGMILFSLSQFSLAFGWVSSPMLLVLLLGFLGTSNILIYAGLFQIFPKKYSGRVSTILNVQVFLGAFLISLELSLIYIYIYIYMSPLVSWTMVLDVGFVLSCFVLSCC